MAFKFRLNVIVKLRKEQEREIQMELAALRQKEFGIENRLAEISGERSSWIAVYNEEGKRIGAEKRLLLIGYYFSALDAETAKRAKELKAVREQIDEASARAKIAYRARQQIEHIRDLQKEQFDQELKKKESREVIELVALRFVPHEAGEFA